MVQITLRKTVQAGLAIALTAGSLAVGQAPTTASSEAPTSGWNDWSCRPSPQHPNPVILLHGLAGSGGAWRDSGLGDLDSKGYCVFTLTYGQASPVQQLLGTEIGGTGPIVESAHEVAAFMDDVLAATGSAQVDLVGHSEGGFLALYIPKVLQRAGDVGKVVTMGTAANANGIVDVFRLVDVLRLRGIPDLLSHELGCQACTDVLPWSDVRVQLVDGPVAQPGVDYTLIHTRLDVFPLAWDPVGDPFLREPGVTNYYVQDKCPLNLTGHITMPDDPAVAAMVTNALDPDHPTRIPCGLRLPI